ncbi:unnamed protein product [Chrysoparadoxa australica]
MLRPHLAGWKPKNVIKKDTRRVPLGQLIYLAMVCSTSQAHSDGKEMGCYLGNPATGSGLGHIRRGSTGTGTDITYHSGIDSPSTTPVRRGANHTYEATAHVLHRAAADGVVLLPRDPLRGFPRRASATEMRHSSPSAGGGHYDQVGQYDSWQTVPPAPAGFSASTALHHQGSEHAIPPAPGAGASQEAAHGLPANIQQPSSSSALEAELLGLVEQLKLAEDPPEETEQVQSHQGQLSGAASGQELDSVYEHDVTTNGIKHDGEMAVESFATASPYLPSPRRLSSAVVSTFSGLQQILRHVSRSDAPDGTLENPEQQPGGAAASPVEFLPEEEGQRPASYRQDSFSTHSSLGCPSSSGVTVELGVGRERGEHELVGEEWEAPVVGGGYEGLVMARERRLAEAVQVLNERAEICSGGDALLRRVSDALTSGRWPEGGNSHGERDARDEGEQAPTFAAARDGHVIGRDDVLEQDEQVTRLLREAREALAETDQVGPLPLGREEDRHDQNNLSISALTLYPPGDSWADGDSRGGASPVLSSLSPSPSPSPSRPRPVPLATDKVHHSPCNSWLTGDKYIPSNSTERQVWDEVLACVEAWELSYLSVLLPSLTDSDKASPADLEGTLERLRDEVLRVLEPKIDELNIISGDPDKSLLQAAVDSILSVLQAAIVEDDAHGRVLIAMGRLLEDDQRLEEAVLIYEEAAALLPGDPKPLFLTAYTLQRLGDREAALECYREVVALSPRHGMAYYNMGYLKADMGDMKGALRCFRKATKLEPLDAQARIHLGSTYMACGHHERADKSYRQAISLDPSSYQAHYNLAISLKSRGELDAAIFHLREAVALDEGFSDAHYNLGCCYTERGQYGDANEAFSSFSIVARLEPGNAEIACLLRQLANAR